MKYVGNIMKTKEQKKQEIKNKIVKAAKVYSKELSNRSFLYAYGDKCIEVVFPIYKFLHLTGVETNLSPINFYQKAKSGKLTCDQFFFSARHTYNAAKRKVSCLYRLNELTNKMVFILKNLKTNTFIYKLSVYDLEFTIGLNDYIDMKGNVHKDVLMPMTLRVEKSSIERSDGGEVVDAIFSKEFSKIDYSVINYIDKNKSISINSISMLKKDII